MITADKDNLLKINDSDSIHNNYNNKLNKNSFILGPKSLTGAMGLPKSFTKVLKPGELYPMEIKIPFESITDYVKVNSLKNVKKLPIGITIDMINYKGQEVSAVIYPCAEIQFSEDG